MSEYCNFAELDKMLRDQMVCGIRDVSLQKKLFVECELTYRRKIEISLAAEANVRHSDQQNEAVLKFDEKSLKTKNHSNADSGASGFIRSATKISYFRCTQKHYPPHNHIITRFKLDHTIDANSFVSGRTS